MTNGVPVLIVVCVIALAVLAGMLLLLPRTTRRLQKQMKFWQNLLERTTVGMVIVSSERRIIEVNRRWCEMFGYSRDELVGQSAEILYSDRAQFEWFRQWFDNARNEGPLVQVEYQHRRKDGSTFWSVVSGGALVLPDGSMGVVWSLTDISDQKQLEAELALERSHMQSLFEVNGSGMLVVSSTRQILQVNNQFCNLFGYSRDELVGQSAQVLHVDQQHYEDWAPRFQEAKAGFPIASADYPWRRKDGSVFWCFFAGVKMELPNGESGVLWNVIDITERKKAEDALREKEDRYRTLLDQATDAIFVSDMNGHFIDVNRKACEGLGYTREELLALSLSDVDPYAEAEQHAEKVWGKLSSNKTVTIESKHRRKDGSSFPVEIHVGMLEINGHPAILGIARDISERKRVEEERRRLVTAIEQGVDSVVITDQEGMIQYVNPSFERITGYGKDEVIGKNPKILQSGKHDAVFYQEMWKALASGKAWQGHLVNKKKDGTLFEEEVSITPVLNEAGKIINYVAVKRDVTGEMRLEEQLRQAQKMEAIGTMAGGIAHDFNNTLQAILGFGGLLTHTLPKESESYGFALAITEAGKSAAELVKQILTFTRQTEVEKQPLKLQYLIKEVLKLLRRTLPSTIELRENIEPSCSPTLADSSHIHQIVMNLGTNAYHALREQGGIIAVKLDEVEVDKELLDQLPELNPGKYTRLTISDNGCGMDQITQQRIFEPYFTTKEIGEGTGLGLAIVHSIISSYNGAIHVQSRLGEGTTFTLFFPALETVTKQEEQKPEPPLPRIRARVLFVDDVEFNVALGRHILKRIGCDVVALTDSREALDHFCADPEKFDLVITDQTMPYFTGFELAQKMLAIRPNLPIIMVTGHSEIVNEKKAKSIGIQKFLMKPMDIATISRAMEELLCNNPA